MYLCLSIVGENLSFENPSRHWHCYISGDESGGRNTRPFVLSIPIHSLTSHSFYGHTKLAPLRFTLISFHSQAALNGRVSTFSAFFSGAFLPTLRSIWWFDYGSFWGIFRSSWKVGAGFVLLGVYGGEREISCRRVMRGVHSSSLWPGCLVWRNSPPYVGRSNY